MPQLCTLKHFNGFIRSSQYLQTTKSERASSVKTAALRGNFSLKNEKTTSTLGFLFQNIQIVRNSGSRLVQCTSPGVTAKQENKKFILLLYNKGVPGSFVLHCLLQKGPALSWFSKVLKDVCAIPARTLHLPHFTPKMILTPPRIL